MKFSIIVPIYNTEEYLHECLDSLKNQIYEDFEVILVNDGSNDNSEEICSEYSQKDPRFKLYSKANGGVSSARNLGVSKASGEYILFVDSDDCLNVYALNELNEILSGDLLYDIVTFQLCIKTEFNQMNSLLDKDGKKYIDKEIINILPEIIQNEKLNSPIKLYRHAFLSDNNLMFDTYSNIGEDYLFNMQSFLKAKFIYMSNMGLYNYRIGNAASLTGKFMSDKYEKRMYINNEVCRLVKHKKHEYLFRVISQVRVKNIFSCISDLFKLDCEYNLKEKINFIKFILNQESRQKYPLMISIEYKILLFLLKINNPYIIYLVGKIIFLNKQRKNLKNFRDNNSGGEINE